ncbi:polyprenyl synthetase family protein [Chitinimonas sp. BJB300]|uniref:polyprenyl synthetase family protein n=1 Tax=Chitinimonas sp. BJB300 TaxID=1559339 RepID=UPI000C10BF28|nr:polyprenyl synthetase family protein [Chitinimonas sp. BJB300]PHV10542.1 octaprenyl diphosphate synthase [Chitinimonas sp. BJB300]TSJ91407.1 octaprenyl diphosphate synthase [Chitinimonas sp. BJB300]
MTIEFVKTVIAADMQAVDALIRDRLHSEVLLVRQVAEYIISSGGKRLRPALTLLSAQALGYKGQHHIELAAVVEFIHTATLLHDDVVDESSLRRGRDTANALFGNAASVLVGDFLYSRAFQMMVGVNDMRVMQILADATNVIAEGEVLQLMNIGDAELNEADYLKVIRYKTAKLFEAAARLGALLTKQDAKVETALASYGMHLGTAFQIVDDVLDYSGEAGEIGKNLGDDLAEGKCTLPLIHAMRLGSEAQAAVVRNAIVHAQRENFADVLAAVRSSGALSAAMEVAHIEAQLALSAIAILPDNQASKALRALAQFAVERHS